VGEGQNVYTSLLERIKARAIAQGTWLVPEEKPPGGEGEAAGEGPDLETEPKPGKKPKINTRIHRNFQQAYPEIFRTAGLVLVYDYLWRNSRKTRTGKLRWCGYIKTVAADLGRSYSQTRADFAYLETCKVIHRWNTGKRFPANIKAGTHPKYHQTIVTVCWNPADYKRQRIIEKKAARKAAARVQKCMSS